MVLELLSGITHPCGLAFALIVFGAAIYLLFPALAISLFLLAVVIIAAVLVGLYVPGIAKIIGFVVIALCGLLVFGLL